MSQRKINLLQNIQQAQQMRSMHRIEKEDGHHKVGGGQVSSMRNISIFKQHDLQVENYERESSLGQQLNAHEQSSINRKQALQKYKVVTEERMAEQDIWKKVEEIIQRIKLKKYIRAFLSLSSIRLFKLLTPDQIKKINDPSFWKPQQQNENRNITNNQVRGGGLFQSSRGMWRKLLKSIKIPIFLPHHILFDVWQFLKIISIMICFYCYLVCFSFNRNLSELFPQTLPAVCQVCMVVDIFVTLNMGVYIKGTLCTDRKQLFNYYKSSRTFYYDISACFFTTLFYLLYNDQDDNSNRASKILLLTVIFKLNDFQIVTKKIKQKFLLDRRVQNIIELINLLKNILIISHIFACIWLIIGLTTQEYYSSEYSSSDNSVKSWLDLMNIEDSKWYIQYLTSYYYISVTMSTVGYGDIHPTNPIEIFASIFILMTCSVMYGFTLNSIGEIVQDFFQSEKLIQEKRYVIANYMDKNYINQITRKNIFEYLEYYWKEQTNENIQEENDIISLLSDNLKEELLIQSNRLILKENKVFKEYFSPELLAKCIPIIKELRFTPNEVIIDDEEGNSDCSIYFLFFGEVEVVYGSVRSMNKQHVKKQEINTLKRGESFGELSFFTGQKESLKFVSKNFSKILKIKREDFIQLLRGDSEQYEIFCKLNDKLIFSSDIAMLYLKCSSCGSQQHDVKTCPSIHFIPRRFKIFGKNQISNPQQRSRDFNRKRDYKFCSLQSLDIFNDICCTFIEQNIEDILDYENNYLNFKHFLKLKTGLQSEDENDDVLAKQKSQQEFIKIATNESPNIHAKKQIYVKRNGITVGFHKSSFESLNGILVNSNDEQIKNSPLQRVQDFMVGFTQKLTGNIENEGFVLDNFNRRDMIEEERYNGNVYKALDKYVNKDKFMRKQTSRDLNNHVMFDMSSHKKDINLSKSKGQVLADNGEQSLYGKIPAVDEQSQFDVFQGQFEKMNIFSHYFPKYNYENVIKTIGKPRSMSKSDKQKSNSESPLNKKMKERISLQPFIHKDSFSKFKQKIDILQQSHHAHSNNPTHYKNQNDAISIEPRDSKMKESIIMNSSLNQVSMLDNTGLNFPCNFDEPETPIRVEKHIIDEILPSIANVKNSKYNFACVEDGSYSQMNSSKPSIKN